MNVKMGKCEQYEAVDGGHGENILKNNKIIKDKKEKVKIVYTT